MYFYCTACIQRFLTYRKLKILRSWDSHTIPPLSSPDHLVFECLLLAHQTQLGACGPVASVGGTLAVCLPLGVVMEDDTRAGQSLGHPPGSDHRKHQSEFPSHCNSNTVKTYSTNFFMILILYNEFIILLLFSNWWCLRGNATLTYTISVMHFITSHSIWYKPHPPLCGRWPLACSCWEIFGETAFVPPHVV